MNRGRQGPTIAAKISALRNRIAVIEKGSSRVQRTKVPFTMGVENIDAILPDGGLARGALHEVVGQANYSCTSDGAALAFAATLAARLVSESRTRRSSYVLWCLSGPGLYGPGLAAFGLTPESLILVRGRDDQQRLWAMEEGLKCTGLAMVVGEVGRLDLGQSRRLQLAAEASGVTALLLRQRSDNGLSSSAALTRWRITPAPSSQTQGYMGIGTIRVQAELLRCKGGRLGKWLLQWNGMGWDEQHEDAKTERQTHPLPLATTMAYRPVVSSLGTDVRA